MRYTRYKELQLNQNNGPFWNANMMLSPSAESPDDRNSLYSQSQNNRHKSGDKTSPISVILVSSGSRGNKLLFRYPFQRATECPSSLSVKPRNPYALNTTGDVLEDQDGDSRFSDSILATILATKSDICGKKFELKIDNVRFVGHPTLLQHSPSIYPAFIQVSKTDPSPKRDMPTMILFNVVFALRANADPSVISCMHNLSRRIAIALQHEERRCQYLTREAKLMLAMQDEITTMNGNPQSPFKQILPKCKLARDLKEVHDRLCTTGVVRLHINNWLEVSFCLPHKIHRVGGNYIPPEALERSLKAIRPYHALLLLESEKALLGQLPLDCSPAMVRRSHYLLTHFAYDAPIVTLPTPPLPLSQFSTLGRSMILSLPFHSLAQNYDIRLPKFHHHELNRIIALYQLPMGYVGLCKRKYDAQVQLIQMVVWMLQRRLLIQLHTYVCLLIPPSEDEPAQGEEELPLAARVGGRSLSTPSALSFGSPTSSDDMTLTSPSMENSSAELLPGGDSPLNKRMTEALLTSLSEHERQIILNIPAAQNPEDLRMFARLLHYFRGHHHLEEIMYNENMRRSQLKTLFDKFRSVLIVTNHEDPIISIFQSPME
ncbi:Nitrogen permease regulator-like 3 [Crenichthys baileyi]|uniref:GATOR complex protein NPRL3 n=1 Tax=Crenichthys baileyi TaxID=28760 RepID=A0AAV9RWS7_9TELE